MKLSITLFLTSFVFALPATAAEALLVDGYTKAKMKDRRAVRGDWKIGEGIAACTQDDALYEKYQKHGPVIWYDVDFTDATIRFSYWADDSVDYFVFTINNGKKHAFRFKQSKKPGVVKAFPREGEENGMLSKKAPALKKGEWVDVEVKLSGESSTVKIGDWTNTGAHPAVAQGKSTIGLGFAFGTMKFRDFSVK